MDFLRLNAELFTVAAYIWLFGIALFYRLLPFWLLVLVISIRVLIPIVYFLSGPDGTWTILDDETYFSNAQILLSQDYSFFDLLWNPDAHEFAAELSEGRHFGFTLFNALLLSIFGEQYCVPVFFNVAFSFLSAFFTWKLWKEWGFSENAKYIVLLFFLLHWDIVAWSSFLNVKDVLVMCMTTWGLLAFTRVVKSGSIPNIFALFFLFGLFMYIRYYVPVLFIATALVWFCICRPSWWAFAIVPAVAALFFYVLPSQGQVAWEYVFWREAAAEALHFFLTPIPWQRGEEYGYLVIAAPLHWLTFPFTMIGMCVLWGAKTSLSRIGVVYCLLTVLFYAFIPELSGPRHRVQITTLFGLFQLAGMLWFLCPKYIQRSNT